MTHLTTAPISASKRTSKGKTIAKSGPVHVPKVEGNDITQSSQPCPYDSKSYHSFARIEKRRYSFCGMRGPKIVPNEPCDACKSGGPGSHINEDCMQDDNRRRHSAAEPSPLAHLADSSSSVLLGPRPVTPERATRRIGNPPRVSKLPPGIIRLPASGSPVSQHHTAASRPPSRLGNASPIDLEHIDFFGNSSKTETTIRPASPKLHYLRALPNSWDFPFVHRNEIPGHAIALHAGSASPLIDRSNTPKSSSSACGPPDYSNTVYYGDRKPLHPASRSSTPRPQVTTVVVKEAQESGRAVIDLQASSLDTVLAGSEVYRRRSPQQTSAATYSQPVVNATDSETTFGSQDTKSSRLGGMRLELKGGKPSGDATPRLRGGSGRRPSTNTFSFKLKRWLLTCHGPCPDDLLDTDSDADLPPPRVVTPERVARMQHKMNGRAPLPAHLSRGAHATRTDRPSMQGLPPAVNFTTKTSGSPRRSISSRLSTLSLPPLPFRRSDSLANQHPHLTLPEVPRPPSAHLRGGADSSDRLPPTLYWLAGGTGRKPIRFSSWKRSLPKKRMGGLFGMAVFGNKYGQAYKTEPSAEVDRPCSSSIEVKGADVANVKDAQRVPDDLGESTSSSTSSSASIADDTLREVTVGVEEAVPAVDAGSEQRALAPSPTEIVDDIPLCSGALPVESAEDLQVLRSAHPTPADASEAQDTAVEVEKNREV
ncbi:hypothetical protein C7974DRAFT_372239 [Boeremia exigua]|uniref:uncharacterized protein n=1 Tax=Boeremia exigua TaxID=749465 RepID=UPI001E8EB34D|nr:uncharacterized protein C7974DRAFT_372239 [Boeremia exigua]KAH6642279.1 hypothetical protein C7974DRAFT_372239 [Boeremia exigua]